MTLCMLISCDDCGPWHEQQFTTIPSDPTMTRNTYHFDGNSLLVTRRTNFGIKHISFGQSARCNYMHLHRNRVIDFIVEVCLCVGGLGLGFGRHGCRADECYFFRSALR